MAASWWRLLAAFLTIFLAAELRAQSAESGRVSTLPNPQMARYAFVDGGPFSFGLPGRTQPPGPPVGQRPVSNPVGFGLIAGPAGMIFSGTVLSIAPAVHGHADNAITFKVDQALRGVSNGETVTIHEWAGLWSGGERYRVGERVVLFLYAPSRLGLTSPVSGGLGRFSVDLAGRIVLSPQHIWAFGSDPIVNGKRFLSYEELALAVKLASEWKASQ